MMQDFLTSLHEMQNQNTNIKEQTMKNMKETRVGHECNKNN